MAYAVRRYFGRRIMFNYWKLQKNKSTKTLWAPPGFFAFFHGHAHGTEIPAASEWAGFAAGLAVASVALMISGGMLSRMIGAYGARRRGKPEASRRRDFEATQRLK